MSSPRRRQLMTNQERERLVLNMLAEFSGEVLVAWDALIETGALEWHSLPWGGTDHNGTMWMGNYYKPTRGTAWVSLAPPGETWACCRLRFDPESVRFVLYERERHRCEFEGEYR